MGMSAALIGLSVAATVGGGIMQHNAAKKQAEAARQQAQAQARIYEQDAERARGEAEVVTKDGAQEEDKLRDRIRAIQGAQRAAYGAAGLSLASGTPSEVAVDTAVQGEEDIATFNRNVARKKFALINQGQDMDFNAKMTRQAGENQAAALRAKGNAALAGSIFSAAGQVAQKWDGLFGSANSASTNTPQLNVQGYAHFDDPLEGAWNKKMTPIKSPYSFNY